MKQSVYKKRLHSMNEFKITFLNKKNELDFVTITSNDKQSATKSIETKSNVKTIFCCIDITGKTVNQEGVIGKSN